jgi:hypothetical protein
MFFLFSSLNQISGAMSSCISIPLSFRFRFLDHEPVLEAVYEDLARWNTVTHLFSLCYGFLHRLICVSAVSRMRFPVSMGMHRFRYRVNLWSGKELLPLTMRKMSAIYIHLQQTLICWSATAVYIWQAPPISVCSTIISYINILLLNWI